MLLLDQRLGLHKTLKTKNKQKQEKAIMITRKKLASLNIVIFILFLVVSGVSSAATKKDMPNIQPWLVLLLDDSVSSQRTLIPNKKISIDGNTIDWGGVEPILTDIPGDAAEGYSYLDINEVYIVQDDDYLYFRIDLAEIQPNNNDTYFTVMINIYSDGMNDYFITAHFPFGGDHPNGDPTTAIGYVYIFGEMALPMQYPGEFVAYSQDVIEFKVRKNDFNLDFTDNYDLNIQTHTNDYGLIDSTDNIAVLFFADGTQPDIDDDGDGYSENQGDCNDTNSKINPSETDRECDGVDNNCSGSDYCTWDTSTTYLVPKLSISVDGNVGDWGDTEPAINDVIYDVYDGYEYLDIQEIYISHDDDYVYFRVDNTGNSLTSVSIPMFTVLFEISDSENPLTQIYGIWGQFPSGTPHFVSLDDLINASNVEYGSSYCNYSANSIEIRVNKSDLALDPAKTYEINVALWRVDTFGGDDLTLPTGKNNVQFINY